MPFNLSYQQIGAMENKQIKCQKKPKNFIFFSSRGLRCQGLIKPLDACGVMSPPWCQR